MQQTLRQFGLLLALLSLSSASLSAQKAAPVRIQFKKGSTRSMVEGSLRGRQQMEYVLQVRKSQKLTLGLESPAADTLALKLRNPDGKEVPLRRAGTRQWTATFAESGDFDIWVVRSKDSPGAARYKLTVGVR